MFRLRQGWIFTVTFVLYAISIGWIVANWHFHPSHTGHDFYISNLFKISSIEDVPTVSGNTEQWILRSSWCSCNTTRASEVPTKAISTSLTVTRQEFVQFCELSTIFILFRKHKNGFLLLIWSKQKTTIWYTTGLHNFVGSVYLLKASVLYNILDIPVRTTVALLKLDVKMPAHRSSLVLASYHFGVTYHSVFSHIFTAAAVRYVFGVFAFSSNCQTAAGRH